MSKRVANLPPPSHRPLGGRKVRKDQVKLPAPGQGSLTPEQFALAEQQVRDFMAEQAKEEAQRQEALQGPAGQIPPPLLERLQALLLERAKRKLDALALYEPLPVPARFHASKSPMRILRGSNRSGKTCAACVEVARAVTGRDPLGKYPKKDGRWFLVGKDMKHLGQVLYRKLFRSGAFKIIRDEVTQQWRSYRPWALRDRQRQHLARPAPPLIPPRFISEIGWENKKEQVPNIVRLHNGWELSFFSSLGKPPQGSEIDGFLFDEEIVDPEWFPEMSARILDRKGCGIWSATPQAGTDVLFDLHEEAIAQRDEPRPSVEEFVVLLADNPHIGEEEKEKFAANLSEEERRVRIEGEFAVLSYKVYPEFSMQTHGVPWFEVPRDWCRYAVIDPGHQVCAVLFAAVPPPHEGDFIYLYDELYIKHCDAAKFGNHMGHKCQGQTFHSFIIDPNMAISTQVASGKTVAEQYTEALKNNKVRSVRTGHGFVFGNDDVEAGILAVHGWLRVGEGGAPKLRVLEGKLPAFDFEIRRYHHKRVAGQITDKPDNRKHNHLMDCSRYLALYDPQYVKPPNAKAPLGGAVRAFRLKQERAREKEGGAGFVRLGPGRAGIGH